MNFPNRTSLSRAIRSIVKLNALFLWCFFALLIMFTALSQLDIFPEENLISALSFIPPLWLVIISVVGYVLGWWLRYRKTSLAIVFIAGLICVRYGDYSMEPAEMAANDHPNYPQISVMAFNVQLYVDGIEEVIDTIKKYQPDIALLSESFVKDKRLERLEQAVQPYRIFLSKQRDTAILSRLPVAAVQEVELPSHQASLSGYNIIDDQKNQPKRSFMHVQVEVGDSIVHAISVRFIAGRGRSHYIWDQFIWGRYLFRTQLEEVGAFTNYIANLQGPLIFGGDLNATPTSPTLKKVRQFGRDVYLAKHNWGDFTFKTKILPSTKEKTIPAMRLDYIFVNNAFMIDDIQRLNVHVSDHFPLLATLTLKPQPLFAQE